MIVCEGNKHVALSGKKSILNRPEIIIALGELKAGFDPAGADERWKTANSALDRIRKGFRAITKQPQLFFVGAAIEREGN